MIDLKHGYRQIPFANESCTACTAMSTPLGPLLGGDTHGRYQRQCGVVFSDAGEPT